MRVLARLIPSLHSQSLAKFHWYHGFENPGAPYTVTATRMFSSLQTTCSSSATCRAAMDATSTRLSLRESAASYHKAKLSQCGSSTASHTLTPRPEHRSPMKARMSCSSPQRQLTTTAATLSPSQGQEPLAGATEQQEDGTQQESMVLLSTGAALLPHPDKAYRGGEDWYFVAGHQQAFGVADGVGGWAEVGVDAGAYARSLMENAKKEAETLHITGTQLCSQHILEQAYTRVDAQGSSTACVLTVVDNMLYASNLGDSGFLVVRSGKLLFQCPQQQHRFNFPYQLGSLGSMSDKPQQAMRFELPLLPGDIIVTGTDGLFDNVFSQEAATVAARCRGKGETAAIAAQVMCRYARTRAADTKYNSPFSYGAMQAGYVYQGGKMDDITVLVTYVSQNSKL